MEYLPSLKVRQLMSTPPLTVSSEQLLLDTVQRMAARRVGATLVADAAGRVVGIFTERDLLRHAGAAPAGWRQRPVGEWMTRDPRTIAADASWEDALSLMDQLHIRHLPVVEDGRVVGMLAARDLMGHRTELLNRKVEERTRELRLANERLQERDAELRLHMSIAGRLQQRLLPSPPPDWPEIEIVAHYAPLDPLGGDHYDFAQPDDKHLGILIADASGHSIPAAMLAIMARTAFANAARRRLQPGGVLQAMNRNLCGLTGEHFVTAFYGLLNRESRAMVFANAGQPFPYLWKNATRKCEPLLNHGLVLGILPAADYPEQCIQLQSGDRLLFYTDGVTETMNAAAEQFGSQRLAECLDATGGQSARSTVEQLLDRLAAFRGACPVRDDITLLCVTIR